MGGYNKDNPPGYGYAEAAAQETQGRAFGTIGAGRLTTAAGVREGSNMVGVQIDRLRHLTKVLGDITTRADQHLTQLTGPEPRPGETALNGREKLDQGNAVAALTGSVSELEVVIGYLESQVRRLECL